MLVVAGNVAVDLLEYGYEGFDESAPLLVDRLSLGCHLLFQHVEQGCVRLFFHLQQGVALLKRFVVAVERLDVSGVVLCNSHVHEVAPLLAAAFDEHRVRRRDKDKGDESDVLRQAFVLFLVAFEVLLLSALHTAIHLVGVAVVASVGTLEHEEVGIVGDERRVDVGEGTPTKREVIDGIQQIRLAGTVVADEAIHLRRQRERRFSDALVVQYVYFFEYHACNRCKGTPFFMKNEKKSE